MNRTLRNGFAVAAMAGGMWFLGQATASANDVETHTGVDQVAVSETTGSGAEAESENESTVYNDISNETTNVAAGGDSNTGNLVVVENYVGDNDPYVEASSEEGDVEAGVEVDASITNDVNVDSGSIANSSNAVIDGDAAGGNDVTVEVDVDQTATSTATGEEEEEEPKNGPVGLFWNGSSGSSESESENESDVYNEIYNSTNNDAEGGSSNTGNGVFVGNYSGDNDPELYCSSEEGDVTCWIEIDASITNNITVDSGDICGSSNASIGGAHASDCRNANGNGTGPAGHQYDAKGDHHDADCPEHAKPADVAPAMYMAPATAKAAVNTVAQPKGELAYTGSDVSAPLTLGLLALGAGGALSLAGRRRQTTTV